MIAVSLSFLALALAAPGTRAQGDETDFDPQRLRPTDITSPRDTLRSFLTHSSTAIDEWRKGELSVVGYRAFLRSMETLDYSTTPDRDSWVMRVERALLLKELIDRIEMPPDKEIPGDAEVVENAITE